MRGGSARGGWRGEGACGEGGEGRVRVGKGVKYLRWPRGCSSHLFWTNLIFYKSKGQNRPKPTGAK